MLSYDLHMHSCLSPCGDELMTPNNIVNMALLIGLDALSVTDHNSLKQQKAIAACAERAKLHYLCGVELQSAEEVHVLGYFPGSSVEPFQKWIDSHSSGTPNNIAFFGHQTLRDENDEVIGEESQLLLDSLSASLKECIEAIHGYGGKAVLAHAYGKSNGILAQLGFIPPELAYDGIEVRKLEEIALVKKNSPWIGETLWLCSSDAHQLIDIHEKEFTLTTEQWQFLKGEAL